MKLKKDNWIMFVVSAIAIIINVSTVFSQNKIDNISKTINDLSYDELEIKIVNAKDEASKIKLATKYLSRAKRENKLENIIYGYWFLTEISDFKKSLKYADSMISFSETKFPDAIPKAYYRKGTIFYEKRMMKEALDSYMIAYKNVAKDSKEMKYYILHSIGLIKNTQGLYKEALPLFIEFETFARENNSTDYIVAIYALAETYNKLGEINKSEFYTDRGLKLAEKLKNDFYYNYFVSNKGKNNFKRKNYLEAIVNLEGTLKKIKNDAKDYTNYAENCYYIGESYKAINKKEIAIKYFKKVDSIFAKENDIYPETLKSYTYLIDFYNKKNDFKNTLYYTNRLIKADSIVSINHNYLTTKLNKEYEIPLLIASRQEIIEKLEFEKSKFQYTIIGLLLLLFSTLTVFICYNRKRQKDYKKQKELFDEFIDKQNEEKEIINGKTNDLNVLDKSLDLNIASGVLNIDQKIVDSILINLDIFEKGIKYTQKDYTIDILAIEFNTNSNYLSKIINEKKGLTFPTYLNNLRIDYIIKRLENESKFRNYTIKAISEAGGYNNVQSFARAFVSRTNMNPSFFIKELISRKIEV